MYIAQIETTSKTQREIVLAALAAKGFANVEKMMIYSYPIIVVTTDGKRVTASDVTKSHYGKLYYFHELEKFIDYVVGYFEVTEVKLTEEAIARVTKSAVTIGGVEFSAEKLKELMAAHTALINE